jgi:hypothetical protein
MTFRFLHRTSIVALTVGLAFSIRAAESTSSGSTAPMVNPVPLTRAHAHNDYEHRRPLLDALECGFCSVEADIFLVDGELLVAHSRLGLKKERTLDRMYLEPLAERVRTHGGSVYPRPAPFTLLIDIKENGTAIYPVLKEKLRRFAPIWTHYNGTNVTAGAITVVLSGDRPVELVKADGDRDCSLDGPMEALEQNWPATLAPLVSASWESLFSWRGKGAFPKDQQERLHHLVQEAHQQGRRLRFWAIPDSPELWNVVYWSGVDLVNTDRLPQLRDFLLQANSGGK